MDADTENEMPHRWRPKACPSCGQDEAFKSQSHFTRNTATRTLDGEGKVETFEKWRRLRCSGCGQEFAMLDKTVTREFDKTGEEHKDRRKLVNNGRTS